MTIGITGHQNIGRAEVVEWVRKQVERELELLRPSEGLSCLAKGADQLFAELLIDKGIPLIAIIPSKDYESTFSNAIDLKKYKSFVRLASRIEPMNAAKADEGAFFTASQYLVDYSNLIIAVWNGEPAKGFGGTADVVTYAQEKNKQIVYINPVLKTIKYI